MKRITFLGVFLGMLMSGLVGVSGERPGIVPMPKIYHPLNGDVDITGNDIFIEENNRQCEIAADEIVTRIKELGDKPGKIKKGIAAGQKGILILTVKDKSAEMLKERHNIDVTSLDPGPQGYVIHSVEDKVIIIGSDNVGALYGAMTLRQMLKVTDDRITVAKAEIKDWPDFRIRTGMSFSRGILNLAIGEKDPMPAIKAGIDWMTRMKMNFLRDYNTIDPRVLPEEYKKLWKKANKYAVERGIYPGHYLWSNVYGYASSRKNLEILPPGIKSKKDWPCVYEARGYREAYYCWSDDEAAKKVIEAEANLIKECNFKVFMYHPVDGGGLGDPEFWSKRCPECRARWKDNERWKATVHQLGMWNRILKEKNPDLLVYATVYPYSAKYVALKTAENEKIWKQNVLDYWKNVNARLDSSIFFISWMTVRPDTDKHRSILMGRPIAYGDCHTKQMGVFSTQSRFYITNYYSKKDMMRTTGINGMGNWMFLFNASEYAWNVASPGCDELKEGMLLYDFERDHTGPEVVIKKWLPKACRTFWGAEIAENMVAFYGSGIQPRYIEDPGASISMMNKQRRDPLADTDPHAKKKVSKDKGPEIIVDDAGRMSVQVKAALKCVENLKAAYKKSGRLDIYKKKLLAKHLRRAPYWLTTARARYDMRTGDGLMKAGKNTEAFKIYREGFERYKKHLLKAEKNLRELRKIPDASRSFRIRKTARQLGEKFKRKIESAETVIRPRQIGKFIKVAVYNGLGAKGTKEFLENYSNIKVTVIDNLSLKTLDEYDCLFMLRDHSIDRFDYYQNLKTYVEKGGGGVIFEHTFCGHKRFELKTPFPDVCKYAPERYDNFDRKIYTVNNPLFRDIKPGTEYKNMYLDFFCPVPGKNGFIIAVDKDKHPVAVAGKAGLGKVIFDGCLSTASVNNSWASEDKKLFGFNAMLAEKAVEWFTGVKLERK